MHEINWENTNFGKDCLAKYTSVKMMKISKKWKNTIDILYQERKKRYKKVWIFDVISTLP